MRPVARFKFVTRAADRSSYAEAVAILAKWTANKFSKTGTTWHLVRSGKPVHYVELSEENDDVLYRLMDLTEPVDYGRLVTSVRMLQIGEVLHVSTTLKLSSDFGSLTIPDVPLGAPRFLREILHIPLQWHLHLDSDRIFARYHSVNTKKDVMEFFDLVFAVERKLPVVVVSSLGEDVPLLGMAEEIVRLYPGLAHVCILSELASWEITRQQGKQWSCFNGAIRVYWPMASSQPDYHAHPLWTLNDLCYTHGDLGQVARVMTSRVGRYLTEASSYLPDDLTLTNFETSRVNRERDESRKALKDSEDYVQLAQSYAEENQQLRAQRQTDVDRIADLQAQVEQFRLTLSAIPRRQVIADATTEIPPQTVAEAVATAQQTLTEAIIFADDIDQSVQTLRPEAGPPDKVLAWLKLLATLSQEYHRGPLGRTVVMWCKERGAECSIESDSTRKNPSSRETRTWRFKGESTFCELHLKLNEKTSPDRVVRIYFAVAQEAPYVRVGYVGRHF